MNGFTLSDACIDAATEKRALAHAAAGACVTFEGWVRDHNEGRRVQRLDYQAYFPLADREGASILAEATRRFSLRGARAVHRIGRLAVGDLAVWVGASADHRDAAFAACRFIIDQIKRRVPIWKKEHYVDGATGWLHPDNAPATSDRLGVCLDGSSDSSSGAARGRGGDESCCRGGVDPSAYDDLTPNT
ncbi:MAG: molybdenum cofactor biosynthesis protein MoaE [Rhodanobacteraceae bacterium]